MFFYWNLSICLIRKGNVSYSIAEGQRAVSQETLMRKLIGIQILKKNFELSFTSHTYHSSFVEQYIKHVIFNIWQHWGLYHRGACDPLASEVGSDPVWRGPCHSPAAPVWWVPSAAAAECGYRRTPGVPCQRSNRHGRALWVTGDTEEIVFYCCVLASFCALCYLNVAI